MKITKIEQKDNIFSVTKTPNFLEYIFGFRTKTERYKDSGCVYNSFPSIRAYINEKGEIIGATNKITFALENFKRKF